MHQILITDSNKKIKRAIQISLFVSVFSFLIKATGFIITGSNTVLSDAAESLVHMLAVAFSFYGIYLSLKPADEEHMYGHERIEFMSVGIEGSVIIMAGISILYLSLQHLILGLEPTNLSDGILVVAAAGTINLILGLYLLRVGRSERNNILIGNGKHTLTDVWTSGGVILTLFLIQWTNFTILDSIVAILVAVYIMYEGGKLLKFAFSGMMDAKNPEQDERIRQVLEHECPAEIKSWHHLRHRTTGHTTWIELHALLDDHMTLKDSHEITTTLEKKIMRAVDGDAVVTIHMEPFKEHSKAHEVLKGYANKLDGEHGGTDNQL